jgi:hypothetical protein
MMAEMVVEMMVVVEAVEMMAEVVALEVGDVQGCPLHSAQVEGVASC